MHIQPTLDHLNLDAWSRKLITEACPNASKIFLAPLDKGLSGSDVWLCRWQLRSGGLSKYHVLKIGDPKKLRCERQAIADVASVLDTRLANVELFPSGARTPTRLGK